MTCCKVTGNRGNNWCSFEPLACDQMSNCMQNMLVCFFSHFRNCLRGNFCIWKPTCKILIKLPTLYHTQRDWFVCDIVVEVENTRPFSYLFWNVQTLDQETIMMTDRDGKKFRCNLPIPEVTKTIDKESQQNGSSTGLLADDRSTRKTPEDLLDALKDKCLFRVSSSLLIPMSWWGYVKIGNQFVTISLNVGASKSGNLQEESWEWQASDQIMAENCKLEIH